MPSPRARKTAAPQATLPTPPQRYREFIDRYPRLANAWEQLHEAGQDGPLDARTIRLAKLAVAIGAGREGAVRSSVRKAAAVGVTQAEIDQVIAIAAATIGMPGAVAAFSWASAARETSRKTRR